MLLRLVKIWRFRLQGISNRHPVHAFVLASLIVTVSTVSSGGDVSISEIEERCLAGAGRSCMFAEEEYHCCVVAGKAYAAGEGVVKDRKQANYFWGKACEEDDGLGCYLWGVGLLKIEKTPEEAMRSFEKACDLGEPLGCEVAAGMFFSGTSVTRDQVRARSLWKKACDYGHGKACHEYSICCTRGEGGGIDLEEACEAAIASCNAGYGPGCESKSTTCHRRLHFFIMTAIPSMLGLFAGVWIAFRKQSACLRLIIWSTISVLAVSLFALGFRLDVIQTNYWAVVASLIVDMLVFVPALLLMSRIGRSK